MPDYADYARQLASSVDECRSDAAAKIAALSPPPVDLLIQNIQDLNDGAWCRRDGSATALGLIRARKAVPALLNMLTSEDRWCCQVQAAVALGKIGDPAAIPHLIERLSYHEGRIREHFTGSALSLGEQMWIGTREHDQDVMQACYKALAILGKTSPNAIDYLLSRLSDPGGNRQAMWALKDLGAEVVPALIRCLSSAPKATRLAVLEILGDMLEYGGHRDAPQLLEAISKALNDTDSEIRAAASKVLRQFGASGR